jgi:hypothetical protein
MKNTKKNEKQKEKEKQEEENLKTYCESSSRKGK